MATGKTPAQRVDEAMPLPKQLECLDEALGKVRVPPSRRLEIVMPLPLQLRALDEALRRVVPVTRGEKFMALMRRRVW